MITWPSILPAPTIDFAGKLRTSAIRTRMDSGRIRNRARFTRSFRQLNVSWELSDYQFGVFGSVYEHSLNSGTDWFNMTLPLGDGMKTYRVRFAEEYSFKYVPVMHWRVSAQLETEDAPSPYAPEILELLLAIDFDESALVSASADLHVLVNETLPDLF